MTFIVLSFFLLILFFLSFFVFWKTKVDTKLQDIDERDSSKLKELEEKRQFSNAFLHVTYGMVLLLFVVAILNSFTTIAAGHGGVVTVFGEVQPKPLLEGFHLVSPISSITEIDTRMTATETGAAEAGTKDVQMVTTDLTVNTKLDINEIPVIYQQYGIGGGSLTNGLIIPSIKEVFKAVVAGYTSEELITKRTEVSHNILQRLQDRLSKYGIRVMEVSMTQFGFSHDFGASVERKAVAWQDKLTADIVLQRTKTEADSRIEKARGEAEAIRISAKAIQSQGGKDYVQLKAVEKWNGELPTYTGGTMPFLNMVK